MIATSQENNEAIANLNSKLSEIMNERSIIGSCLVSPFSKVTNLENTSQFKLVKDYKSNRVNDILIHNTITVTLHDKFFNIL